MTTNHCSPTQFAHTSNSSRADNSRDDQVMRRFPTSPWTEAYQAASSDAGDAAHDSMSSASHSEMQAADYELQPTRDALSDIYNRGYSD